MVMAALSSVKGKLNPASSRPALEKAKILFTVLDTGERGEIACQFNPESLAVQKGANWFPIVPTLPDLDSPPLVFAGGQPAFFAVDLFFDTTQLDNQDVRGFTNRLLMLTLKGGGSPASDDSTPPLVKFVWGELTIFQAVITNVIIRYTMFLANGTPVRARASVTLMQATDIFSTKAPQNPTSRTDPRKTYLVRQGDRLDYIAFRQYGEAYRWRDIAEANQLNDPLDLRPGQILIIPQD